MKNNFLINVRRLVEFIIVYFIYIIISIMPINFSSFLGGFIFKIFGPKTKTEKIVRKNLLQIGNNISNINLNRKNINPWINMGKTFFELLILPKIMNAQNKINIEGIHNIKEIIEKKEKAIFIGIHQSNWEILLPSIDKLGIAVGGIYRHINNPLINSLILKIREKSITSNKSFYTPKGKKSAKDIIENIKNKNSIVLLVDQKDSAGEMVKFFNFPCKTQTGFIKIARKYKMKIIPVENIRNLNNSFTLKFCSPIENISSNQSDIEVMEMINVKIEKWIKSNPSNWFLQHNRFS